MRAPLTLTIRNVSKTYPNGLKAVDDLSLEVEPGQVFGLVGPNGAGKSTLLKVAAGLMQVDQGDVFCGDEKVTGNPALAAGHLVLMPDPLGVYTDISCRQYLQFFSMAYGITDADRAMEKAVEQLGLGPWMDEEVETLSAGWQRRLALARVLLVDPPILLLDEPAAGLDVGARMDLLKVVRSLVDGKRTMIVSSHILPELEELADRFGILQNGKWVPVEGDRVTFSSAELQKGIGRHYWSITCDPVGKALQVLQDKGWKVKAAGACVEIDTESAAKASEALGEVLAAGVVVHEFKHHKSNLSGVTLELLSREAS